MKALLLAAGEGRRLRPFTETTPKCLMPIQGKPLLEIWLQQLHQAGVEEFIVNACYLAEQVERFLEKSQYASHVTLIKEESLKGTAGTLLANRHLYQSEPLLLVHADNLCHCDWSSFLTAHQDRPPGSIMTMMTFTTETPSSCGIVELNDDATVRAFHEKVENPPSNRANAAICLLEPEVIELIREMESSPKDFCRDVIPHLGDKVYTWHNDCYMRDIGTPESYRLAQAEWLALHS